MTMSLSSYEEKLHSDYQQIALNLNVTCLYLYSVLFPTASKNCIFKLPTMKLSKRSFYSTVLLQLCICNCVNFTQRDFISTTIYTEVPLKCERDGLLRNLVQGNHISPHVVWGFIFQVCHCCSRGRFWKTKSKPPKCILDVQSIRRLA